MSIASVLTSRFGKGPRFLAELTRGAEIYRYNLGRETVIFEGDTYAGSPVSFTEISYSSEIQKDDLTLDGFPLSSADAQAFIAGGAVPLTLILRRGFRYLDGFVVCYRGQLTATKPGQRQVSLVFGSWAIDASRRGDGAVAQRQCPWRVYSADCGAVQAAFEVAGTATAYASGVVTCAAAGGSADGTFSGGLITYAGDARTISKHLGSALTLAGSFPALAAEIASAGSAAVTLAPGCDKSATTCRDRFANIANHLGFAAMSDNPFTQRIF